MIELVGKNDWCDDAQPFGLLHCNTRIACVVPILENEPWESW